jgi:hypothetical protein
MSTEIAERAVAVNPATGEALVLAECSTGILGRALDEIRETESKAREFKARVTEEILSRMDALAQWTIHMDGYKITGDSPATHGYDVVQLRATLERLVADGSLAQEAAIKGIVTKVEYAPAVAGLNALSKLGPEVKEAIHACETPKTRYVKISRES